jgi:fructosamine-3-kinase
MKFIESAEPNSRYWENFAHDLASLHKADTSGLFEDLPHSATPQQNVPADSWVSFFRQNRLAPQFKAADSCFTDSERTMISKLLDHLDKFLPEPKQPSLVHGDLWSGNVMCGKDGKALLIDPASYVGHAEVDLAMTELFGGFPQEFYEAYRSENPLEPGYEERRDLYNLYQLLNHLNLFGKTYLEPVLSIVREYVG